MIETEVQPQEIDSQNLPTVSVIIPAYNASKYIGEALQSVLNQSLTSYEIIVINDGSPDTAELELQLEPFAGRIRYIRQDNAGAAAARNTGLRAARGEMIGFLDADDLWLPHFLEEQLSFLSASNADFVFADALLFGNSPLGGRTFMEVQPSCGAVTPENLLAVNVSVLTSAVLARKQPILNIGLFDETIKRGHDFDLWLRLAKFGVRFAYHRKVLAHYRIMESGLSGDTISQLTRTLGVLEAIKTRGGLTASEEILLRASLNKTLAQLAIEQGKDHLRGKDFGGALKSFKEAKKFRRSWKLMVVCLALRIAPETLWRFYSRREMAAAKQPPDGTMVAKYGKSEFL